MKRTAIFCLFAALLLGCAAKPDLAFENAGVLSVKPSELAGQKTLWDATQAEAFRQDFLKRRYEVWSETYEANATRIEWPWTVYTPGKGYGANRRLLLPEWFAALSENAQIAAYPTRNDRAIALRAVDLRNFPTEEPFFKDFNKAGEGYPFDYLQNSRLHAQHPVRVTHQTGRGDWIFIESDHAHGWARPHEVALIEREESAYLSSLPLGAVAREKTLFYGYEGRFLFEADIGALLPVTVNDEPVIVRGENGKTKIVSARVERGALERWPLEPSAQNLARLADSMTGKFYGWGGMDGGRDCSSLMRDLFAPIGRFLPRNSNQQANAGAITNFDGLDADARLRLIASQGRPFTTLINFPGHVGLYLGEVENEPVMLHATWGHKVKYGDHEDRLIIGETVITPLRAGAGLDKTNPNGLIERATGMTTIDKEGL